MQNYKNITSSETKQPLLTKKYCQNFDIINIKKNKKINNISNIKEYIKLEEEKINSFKNLYNEVKDYEISKNEIILLILSNNKIIKIGLNTPSLFIEEI